MGDSDWLAAQAEHEKNSRLYGGKPPLRPVWRALLAALAWSVGSVCRLIGGSRPCRLSSGSVWL